MNYDILACFPRFYHFLNFGWFWDGFSMNFDSPASFPARRWLQITETLKFYKNRNFINNVTGRNKIHQNINFWLSMNSSFRLRLELSLCMRSLFHSNLPGKLSKCKTTVQNFHTMKILGPKYSTPLLILILRLAAPCHRITL